jgi:tetratricopeptide (TPR) repeat protein
VYRLAKSAALADAWARLQAGGADAELVTLAQACLAPERPERPRHAGVVAEAVAAYQARVQERLRAAEVTQAQAQVQLAEERKRRRLAWVLAAALVLLVAGGAAAALWSQQQEAAHQLQVTRAQAAIGSALEEADQLAVRCAALTEQLPAWRATLDAAGSALQRAEDLRAQEQAAATAELVQRLGHLRARLEEDRKDWQLLAVYDQVRLEQSQWDSQRRQFRLAEAYPRLAQALADYGLAIGGLGAAEAAARLRQRPPAVRPQLRAVLEECRAWVPKGKVGQRQWLAAVLAVDADPWLEQFRGAAKGAWAELERLASQAEVSRYHPAVLVGLARTLPEEAQAGKLALLRRTQQQYPGDFWVNFGLGGELFQSVFPRGRTRPARAEELPVVNEAAAFYRVAVGLRPGDAPAHSDLGGVLRAQGDLAGAIACFRKAIDLDPKEAKAHNNLGKALQAQGDVKGAIEHWQKALDLNPEYAEAHCNLGNALFAQGDFAEALKALQRGHQLGSQRPSWRYPSARWVDECQRLLALDTRLSALLKGEDQPKDAAEQLALADLCQRYKKRYAAAARFYADAFAAGATRSSQRTYNASCAAILAAAGNGEDAAKLDAQEKTRLRQQALAWLKNALNILDKLVEDPERRDEVRQKLQHWQKDPGLASVRGQEALAKLPEAERAAWQQLWAEVETLCKKAAAANSP